ncbi:MAG: queuosine precursor transporter [bacterium]
MFKIKKFDFLVSIYIFCIAVAELMGAKTFHLLDIGSYALNASVAIFVIPILFTINDMIVEVYGKVRARSVIRSSLVVIFLFFLFSLLVTALPPSSRFAESETAYDSIFVKSARISAASLIAFALAEFLDVYIFARLRKILHGKALWLRNNLSNFISQFVDTTVFMFLAFYTLSTGLGDNFSFLFSLILPYWLLKCSMSVIETPFVYLGVRWLRNDKTPKDNLLPAQTTQKV